MENNVSFHVIDEDMATLLLTQSTENEDGLISVNTPRGQYVFRLNLFMPIIHTLTNHIVMCHLNEGSLEEYLAKHAREAKKKWDVYAVSAEIVSGDLKAHDYADTLLHLFLNVHREKNFEYFKLSFDNLVGNRIISLTANNC